MEKFNRQWNSFPKQAAEVWKTLAYKVHQKNI